MDLKEIVRERRAYRSLAQLTVGDELIRDLAETAALSASCNNNQPWRFVFVRDPQLLAQLASAMSKHNDWTRAASLIIAVASKKELDCLVKEREYFLFDTGMATAFLILRATELGLVAHPIAGYDEAQAKQILGIPEDMRLITLVIVGRHSLELSPLLSEKQREAEKQRPERKPLAEIMRIDRF